MSPIDAEGPFSFRSLDGQPCEVMLLCSTSAGPVHKLRSVEIRILTELQI